MVSEHQTEEVPRGKPAPGLLLSGALVLVGLGAAVVVLGGLPSRAEGGSIAESGQVAPITGAGEPDLPVAPEIGALAPDFSLKTPDGDTYTLSDLRGRPVLVNFWATWCGPCRLEMPAFQQVYEARAEDGFIVLAVDHTATDTVPLVVAFGEELGLTFPLLIDPGSEVQNLYRIRAYPSSFFVDVQGVIQNVHFGPITEGQLDENLDELLR